MGFLVPVVSVPGEPHELRNGHRCVVKGVHACDEAGMRGGIRRDDVVNEAASRVRLSQAISTAVEDLLVSFTAEDLSFSDDNVRHIPFYCLPNGNEANTLILAEIPELATFFLRQLPPTGGHTHRHACAHKTIYPTRIAGLRGLLPGISFF